MTNVSKKETAIFVLLFPKSPNPAPLNTVHEMATNVTELVAHVHHKPLVPDLLAPSLSVPLKFPYQGGLYTWRGASSGTVCY